MTLIYAPNGTGKTSFIDAAEWILTDEIRRMEKFAGKSARNEIRCKFSPESIATEVTAVLELDDVRHDLFKTPRQWILHNADTEHKTKKAILKALAPNAADDAADEAFAPAMRRIWLRGTRFLTESDLSILIETDPDIHEERRQILSDLMGISELEYRANEFRKFAAYLKNGCNGEKGIAVIEKELTRKKQDLLEPADDKPPATGDEEPAEASLNALLHGMEKEKLRRETAAMEKHLTRLKAVRRTAEGAAKAFTEQGRRYCRWQKEGLSDVMFSIFARIHANETFDFIKGGPEDDPFEWIAMAAGREYITSRDFSMGQRQDLALSIFLAKARGIGGTFFLDEPMIRLDDLNRVALLDMFRMLIIEEGSRVHLVITTASRSLVRHFQEKFTNIPDRAGIPVLRVIELEGSARDGVRSLQDLQAVSLTNR